MIVPYLLIHSYISVIILHIYCYPPPPTHDKPPQSSTRHARPSITNPFALRTGEPMGQLPELRPAHRVGHQAVSDEPRDNWHWARMLLLAAWIT